MTTGRLARARQARTFLIVFVVIAAVGGVLLLIIGSPVMLRWVAGSGDDWERLGNTGQAYGGTSAILSGLALCGVAASLLLQWRQARIVQLYSARHHQLDLARLVLENSDALVVEGAAASTDPHASSMVIANQWVASWATAWQLGAIDEDGLRDCGRRLFEVGYLRDWWRAFGSSYATSARGRRFVEILNRECEARDRLLPAARQRSRSSARLWPVVALVVAVVAVAAAARPRLRAGPPVTGLRRTPPPGSPR
jgi:hypothetical protein